MGENPLNSLASCSRYLAEILAHPMVVRSTVAVWSDSPFTGTAEGEVWFRDGMRPRMREEIDFDACLITAYGYEVYRGDNRVYWYDDFPHPGDGTLAATFPHHKHVPPDIKRHRVPAPGLSFTLPNLAIIVNEIIDTSDSA